MSNAETRLALYFAHPVNTYNTPLEERAIRLLERFFPTARIENPNQPHHAAAYQEYKKKQEDQRTGRGMRYFFDVVLPACNGCGAMPFLDGKIGAGVAGEAAHFIEKGQPVYMVEAEKESVRLFTKEEARQILDWSNMRTVSKSSDEWLRTGNEVVSSIEETRLRTWRIYNRERRPYEEAHLVSMPIPPGFYPEKS